jgi:HEPN domain-containing protein
MTTQERVLEEFASLQQEGQSVCTACGWDGKEFHRRPSEIDYLRIRTRAVNLIRRACGENSDHYGELHRLSTDEESATNSRFLSHCLGVVAAAKHDFERGLLFDLRALVNAEILGDFMEQAERLLEENYYVPAASLAGAVLEDTLRKLCDKNGLTYPDKTTIDRLNADLAKAGIYDKLVQKRITALADIRNNADHGKFDKFAREDVEDMVKWLRRFTADYLG